MLYVGLDIHKSHITGCVLDGNGKVEERWQVADVDQLMQRLLKLPAFAVCYEASTGYGRFHELLSTAAVRAAVAHPGLLRLIFRSKQKNDRANAPVVRAMLTEAVWQAVRRSPTVRAFQQRVERGETDRRKISVIATAHDLVRVTWSMLKNGAVWNEQVSPAAA